VLDAHRFDDERGGDLHGTSVPPRIVFPCLLAHVQGVETLWIAGVAGLRQAPAELGQISGPA
jgi:hypothetical protein